MTDRSFPEVTIPQGRGRTKALRITCGECGTEAFFCHLGGRSRKPPIAAVQHFQREGWVVGSSHRKDRCPKHVFRQKEKRPMENILPLKAEPPREMGREDRRIITEKLDEVYGSDAYRVPWTDAAVAKDLGVPRQWVSTVREQFFGPEGGNPLLDDYLRQSAQIAEMVARVDADVAALRKTADMIKAAQAEIAAKMADLARIGSRIEKELGR